VASGIVEIPAQYFTYTVLVLVGIGSGQCPLIAVTCIAEHA